MKRGVAFLFLLLFFPIFLFAQSPSSIDPAALLAEGDQMYETRDAPGHADKAIEIYKKIIDTTPKNDAALWRLARSFRWRGDIAEADDEKLANYKEMERWAKKAIEADPNSVGGHLMLGIAYGRIGETQGVMKSLSLISPIKNEMNAVLSREPQNDTAHHVLGVLYRKVPGLMGGSIKKSIEELEEAVRSNPNGTTHSLELARSYLENGRKKEAKGALERLLAISTPSDRVQSKMDRDEAQELLANLKSP